MEFYKVSGGGNDFIALPEPPREPSADEVRSWCRRALSLGADGLFILRRQRPGRVGMTYFNADGGTASLCLNGTRCAARLALELGWSKPEDCARVEIETGAGVVAANRPGTEENHLALDIPLPAEPPRAVTASALGQDYSGWLLTVGVPHFILVWPASLNTAPVATLGRALVHHPALGPAGANIDFLRLAGERLELRTYERGVYGETLACGTGIMAAAVVALEECGATLPLTFLTAGGCLLEVAGELDPQSGRPHRWSLAGDARIIAHGHLAPGASMLPEAPRWS